MIPRPTRNAAAALAVAAGLTTGIAPSAAQTTSKPGPRLTEKLPAGVGLRIAVREWSVIPEQLIRIEMPPGWKVKRKPDGRIGSQGIYAEFNGFAHPGKPCAAPSVTIDLRPIRAHRFQLVEVVKRHVKAPKDFWLTSGPRRDGPTDMSALEELRLFATPYGTTGDRRFPSKCWAALDFSLRIRGPEGVDPLTGNAYPPSNPVR